jgi:hypothetical protein
MSALTTGRIADWTESILEVDAGGPSSAHDRRGAEAAYNLETTTARVASIPDLMYLKRLAGLNQLRASMSLTP